MDHKLIIIIGLPGSGKTTYMTTLDTYVIFDDFLDQFFNGRVISAIKNKENVCIADPRLCLFDVFTRIIDELERYIDRTNIKLIQFENNPELCVENISLRNDNRKGIIQSIYVYSTRYILSNYEKWDYIILPVQSHV